LIYKNERKREYGIKRESNGQRGEQYGRYIGETISSRKVYLEEGLIISDIPMRF
jgi:hypothetical protein